SRALPLALAFMSAALSLHNQNAIGGPPPAELQIIKTYCACCHSESKQKAGLVLPTDTPDFASQHEIWTTVLERVNEGTMPPEGKPRPTADERKALAGWIRSGLIDVEQQKTLMHGRARLRRLN